MIRPEFFDIFGFLGFIYIIIFSSWFIYKKRKIPKWTLIILLILGIIGLIVDGSIVYTYYFMS
jgi:multidrug transporter EmrE-like cation transporter